MKKLLLSALSILTIGTTLNAQNFVSTTVENKNVVLEEFTGIYCGWCPAGHKIASDFYAANPNDVVLINMHTHFTIPPINNDPDFRSIFDRPIDQQANVQGYPAGTINRRNFPGFEQNNSSGTPVTGITAMSRGNWISRGNVVLGETSPVNVAAEATINLHTRELKVVVETYFTAAAGTAPYKLNVALLQNNVEGPQANSSLNPSAVLPNGNYNHQHMLRHYLTGQWGIDITSTAAGYFQVDTFTYVIPTGFAYSPSAAIPTELQNMEVVVFVAEGQQTILTGNKATMSYTIPSGMSTASTQIAANPTTIDLLCDYNYTPILDVSNNSTSGASIDSFLISYTLNNGTPVTQLITSPLAANSTTTISFPQIQLGSGENNILYEIDFDSYNSTLIDLSLSGDNLVNDGPYTKLSSNAIPAPVSEGCESAPLIPGTGYSRTLNTAIFQANGQEVSNFGIIDGPTYNYGAIGGMALSNRSILFKFYSIQSGSMSVIMQKINLGQGSQLTFNHAHRQYQTESDALEISISTDCGATWTTLWNRAGATLMTLPALNSTFRPSIASDWRANTIDLSAYDNTNDVIIRFTGTSAYGNNLYLDDINVSMASNIAAVPKEAADVRIMPNPVTNNMTLEFTMLNTADANINILNTLGQQVQSITNGSFSGITVIEVNTSDLAAGVYFVNITTEKGTTTKRFVRQ